MGEGIRSSKKRSGSCSSRVKVIDEANDTDVELIDIEDNKLSNSDDTIADSDEDDNASIFSTSNEYASEDDDTLPEEERQLLEVRAKRTDTNATESAENSLLTREAVVRFMQDLIANAVYRQKLNADKHGRENVLLFNVEYFVLLSKVNTRTTYLNM